MEEELLKRNTDCVYFLASPLTCKKGIECEYRHSEIARLNPRDCWYWLAGSCLNPTCAFRHPPLDGLTEASSESAPPHYQSTVSGTKTNVPCYFYFNGFCSKGDRCLFMHAPHDGELAWKSSKITSAVTDALPMEKKTSAGSETGSTPIETHLNLHETVPQRAAEICITPKEDIHQSAPGNVADRSASPRISVSASEEAAAVKSDFFLPPEGFVQSPSLVCTDESSEDQVDGHIEREEWLESSPGFDVLVDDRSENLGYEDDPEYLLALDTEDRELNGKVLGYDYEDPVEYDPAYPEARISYEQETHDSCDHEHTFDYVRENPVRPREIMLDRIMPRKRPFLPMELAFNDRSCMDLREHLKKRRGMDGHSRNHFSRRVHSSHLIGRSREKPRLMGPRHLHGRLVSKVGNNIFGSHIKDDALFSGVPHKQGMSKHYRMNRPIKRFPDKRQSQRQFLSSEVSREVALKKRRFREESSVFTGPKTLAQIKEEKRKVQENEGGSFGKMGSADRIGLEDFEGPKPLSEVLKDKRRLGSVVDCNNATVNRN